jgi:hypothetical protein
VIDGIDFPAITSLLFEECETAEQVLEHTNRLKSAFKDAAQIDQEFTLGAVIDYSITPPRRHIFLEAQPCTIFASCVSGVITISPSRELIGEELEKWKSEQAERQYQSKLESQRSRLEPAFWSTRAEKVLKLLSSGTLNGEIIYKIY